MLKLDYLQLHIRQLIGKSYNERARKPPSFKPDFSPHLGKALDNERYKAEVHLTSLSQVGLPDSFTKLVCEMWGRISLSRGG